MLAHLHADKHKQIASEQQSCAAHGQLAWEADTGDTGARTNMTNPTKCVSFAPIVADNERAGVLVRKSALKKTSSHPPVSARRNHAGLIDLRCAWGVVINAGFLDLCGVFSVASDVACGEVLLW